MNEFDYCYCNSIEKVNDKYIVNVTGDTVWNSFSDILYDIEELNNLNPAECDIVYLGTFGEEYDEWCESVMEVSKCVNSITITDTANLTQEELDTIIFTINKFDIKNIKLEK